MKKIYVLVVVLMAAVYSSFGQVAVSNASPTVTLDFSNAMPTTAGSNPSTAYTGAGFAPNPTTAGQLNSNAWAVTGWSDGNLAFGGTNTAGDYSRGATAAAVTTGGFYAFTGSPASASNPIFWIQPGTSDWASGTLTLKIVNNGTQNISALDVSYKLYVRNDQGRSTTISFSYSSDNSTYTPVPALDYSSAATSDGLGVVLVDGAAKTTTVNALNIAPGGFIYLRWSGAENGGSGSRDEFGLDDISFTATYTAASTPDIALSSPNPAIAAGNIMRGSSANPLYRFDLAVTTATATLTDVTVNTAGSYTAADLYNLKLWYSADASFDAGTDMLLSTVSSSLDPGAHTFSSFSQNIASGASGYFFVTADMPCAAVTGNTISVNAVSTSDLTFSSGNKTGSAFAGGTKTIIDNVPNDVPSKSASIGNGQSTITWGTPSGCYDEIMVVAATATNTGVPTGDGTAYSFDLNYGAGTALGNGVVVYKGNSSPQTILGLTNGTQYFLKFFVRSGTSWSAGTETTVTPAVGSSATDYFRSAASGNWGDASTWETSVDGATNWTASTLVPTTSSSGIEIQNTHTVTVAATASADQLVVDAGGTLSFNANFTVADGAGTDLTVNGTVINTSGTITTNGTVQFNANSLYQHNRNSGGILTATWDPASTAEIIGVAGSTGIGGANQNFGNFTWNNSGQTATLNLTGNLSSVAGNLYIENVGSGTLRFTGTADLNLVVGGDMTIAANVDFDNSATGTSAISVGGNFTHSAGSMLSSSDQVVITLTGTGKTLTLAEPAFGTNYRNIDWVIGSGASYTLASDVAIAAAARSFTVDGSLNASTYQITGPGTVNINGMLVTGNVNGVGIDGSNAGTIANAGGTTTIGSNSRIEYGASAFSQDFSARSDYANVIISGGTDKILSSGPAVINGTLDMSQSGNIVTNSTDVLTIKSTGNVVGGSSLSYIDGPVIRETDAASDYLFPLGKSGQYEPAIVTPSTVDPAAFQAEYFNTGSNTTSPTCNPSRVEAYAGNEYWDVSRTSGTTAAKLSLYYRATDVAGNWTDGTTTVSGPDATKLLTIAHYNGTCWQDENNAFGDLAGNTGSGFIISKELTSFSPFTIGFGPLAALPVNFGAVRAYGQGSAIKVDWSNLTETDVVSYTVERSANGRDFISLGTVAALHNNGGRADYSFVDAAPLNGSNFYRILSTERNNNRKYSLIVQVETKGAGVVSLYPNPVTGHAFTLQAGSLPRGDYNLRVVNAVGQQVYGQALSHSGGVITTTVELPASVTPGIYTLLLENADQKLTRRFTVQ